MKNNLINGEETGCEAATLVAIAGVFSSSFHVHKKKIGIVARD